MKIRNIVIVGTVSLSFGGCAIYDGAIYTSYDQVDLSIRSAPETATPFNINFGRQRAVVSFVPHKDEQSSGEAVSVFGWTNTASITPDEVIASAARAATKAATTATEDASAAATSATTARSAAVNAQTALAVANAAATERAAGTAANEEEVAVVVEPAAAATAAAADLAEAQAEAASRQAATTAVQAANNLKALENLQKGTSGLQLLRAEGRFATGNAAKVLVIPGGTKIVIQRSQGAPQVVKTLGTPAARVGAAFSPSTRFRTSDDERYLILEKRIDKCSLAPTVRDTVAEKMGACFKGHYDHLQTDDTGKKFGRAQGEYLANCPDGSAKKLNQEIESVLKFLCPN